MPSEDISQPMERPFFAHTMLDHFDLDAQNLSPLPPAHQTQNGMAIDGQELPIKFFVSKNSHFLL